MIELRTLGLLDLRGPDGREVRSVLAQPKRLALLVYLATGAPGGFARRDTLLGLFWPESDDERARGALRQAVRYLRSSLGAGTIVNRAEDELGIAQGTLSCDAVELRAAVARGEHEAALDLYRGDLLEGFFVSDAPKFERWLDGERTALRKLAAGAAWALADRAVDAGDDPAARKWAGRAVELAPHDESGVRRLVSLLDGLGDRAGAVVAYEDFARRLAAELDLEPSPGTRALVDEIRSREEAATVAPDPGWTEVAARAPEPRSGIPPGRPSKEAALADPPESEHPPLPGHPREPQPAARGRASRRPVLTGGGVLALIVFTGAFALWSFGRGSEPPLDARRIVVAPFENRTGDAALDPVTSMAADWIVQGLAGRGALEVVPVTAALASARAVGPTAAGAGAAADPRPLARETGAGTAVTGSFYRQADSLYFQARVIDAASGRVLAALEPVGTGVESPLEGIDRLRQRVLLALAPLSDERDTHVRVATSPPSYEAYRSYVTGFESFVNRDPAGALRYFERAASADSTFHMPAIAAAIMHMNLGGHAAADSVARRVNRFRDDLAPFELATLDMVLGWLAGDNHAAWEASVRQARIAPGSIGEYQVAEQARRLNRPAETVRVLTAMGPERGELRGWLSYWRELADAHHMLGDHRAELRAARQAREHYPGVSEPLVHEVAALAALGRVSEVHARIEERLGSGSRDWPSPGALMSIAARELRAHGRPDAAADLFERSLEWYRAQAAAGGPAVDYRATIGLVLYESGRPEAAGEIYRELVAEKPDHPVVLGNLGAIAARRGDMDEAAAMDARLRELDQAYLWGVHTFQRARIAAVLGDRDRAVELLRAAFTEGALHGRHTHLILDLEELRGHPPFDELMRPRE
jgi:DNA-binding SARP family transcriptional activator/TolB-like protein